MLAIANILSPERMSSKRKHNRDNQALRRSEPEERERYNASQAQLQAQHGSNPAERERYNASQAQLQAQLYQQSKANRNSNMCERAILEADEDGGWEETKQTEPTSNVDDHVPEPIPTVPVDSTTLSDTSEDCYSDD